MKYILGLTLSVCMTFSYGQAPIVYTFQNTTNHNIVVNFTPCEIGIQDGWSSWGIEEYISSVAIGPDQSYKYIFPAGWPPQACMNASSSQGMFQESKGRPLKMGNKPAWGSPPGVYHLINLPPPVAAIRFIEVVVMPGQEIVIEPHKQGDFNHRLTVFQNGNPAKSFTFEQYVTWSKKNDSNQPWTFKFEDQFVRECNGGLLTLFSEEKEKKVSNAKLLQDSPSKKKLGFDDYPACLFCNDDCNGDGDFNDVWVDVILK